jgi:hypothetical protein
MNQDTDKSGYYSVAVDIGGRKVPYIVLAQSDFHAARKVRDATGYLADERDVEGPFRSTLH